MIKEPSENVNVEIIDRKTNTRSQPQVFKAPKPGMVTIWDYIRVNKEEFEIRIDWPLKQEPLIVASRDFVLGWEHFLSRINWENSHLDAEAVRFMNEVPGKIANALGGAEKNNKVCGLFE